MFSGIGIWEILLILLIVLLVMGPDKIPDVARMLGKGMREARRATNYFRDMFTLEEEPQHLRRDDDSLREHERRMQQMGGGGPVDQPMEAWERQQAAAGRVAREDMPRGIRPVRLGPPRGAADRTEVQLDAVEIGDTCRRIDLGAGIEVRKTA